MTNTVLQTARLSIRTLIFASLFSIPVGSLAFNGANGPTISKQGAGFVLYVSLQRNAMK